jgi:hypothetical protein
MTQETKWTARLDDFGACYSRPYVAIDDGAKSIIAVWTLDELGRSINDWRGNALKAAAAPELYEALEWAVEVAASYFNHYPDRSGKQIAKLDAARAALAKARGEDH